MAFFSHPSVKLLLSIGVASCIGLTGCNKLGYGEPRTAPEGQAVLGPKRLPQMNEQEIQRQQQAFQTGQSQPMQAPPRPAPQMQPMPMQQIPPQQQAPQPRPPQIPANYPVTPVGPQSGANNPYANGSQSYQMPNQQRQQQLQQQQQQQMQSQQGAYQLPQNFPAGSYYGAQQGQQQQAQQGMARTVSANPTDYYMQDMLQQPLPVIMGQAQQGHRYHQAVPVGQVQGGNLSPVSLQDYQAGFAMEAAYGRYQQQMPAVPPQPNAQQPYQQAQPYQQPQSYYQPMNANQAELYPALDPYAAELNQPEYNNYFYGGEGMPQGHDPSRFAPNFEAAAQGQAMTNGFGQRASGMINNPASNEQRYLGESLRRPLEEPPMLGVQSELPNPNTHSQLHYGNGSYR